MPLYEYRCDTCGGEFEQMMRFSEADIQPACPQCGSPETTKKISRVGSFGDSAAAGSYTSGSSCGSRSGFS